MFTTGEKAQASAMLDDVFDSFKENIFIYKTAKHVLISSQPTYNFAYGESSPTSNTSYITSSGVFEGTIQYLTPQETKPYPIDSLKLGIPQADVKICVKGSEARDFLNNSEKIVFDGNNFKISNGPVPRGIFSRNYYDYWLEKIK